MNTKFFLSPVFSTVHVSFAVSFFFFFSFSAVLFFQNYFVRIRNLSGIYGAESIMRQFKLFLKCVFLHFCQNSELQSCQTTLQKCSNFKFSVQLSSLMCKLKTLVRGLLISQSRSPSLFNHKSEMRKY